MSSYQVRVGQKRRVEFIIILAHPHIAVAPHSQRYRFHSVIFPKIDGISPEVIVAEVLLYTKPVTIAVKRCGNSKHRIIAYQGGVDLLNGKRFKRTSVSL